MDQPLLFADPPPISKDAYYIAISGMQKAIRFGQTDIALRLARVAWLHDPSAAFKRLFVIMAEDIAPDYETWASVFHSMTRFSDWSFVRDWVELMALSPKSRELSCILAAIKNPQGRMLPPEIAGVRQSLLKGSFSCFRDLGCTEEDIQIARVFYASDRDRQELWLPYLLMLSRKNNTGAQPVIINTPPHPVVLTTFKGILPYPALDQHTRPGKLALSVFGKRKADSLQRAGFASVSDFGEMWWATIGCWFDKTYPTVYADSVAESWFRHECGAVFPKELADPEKILKLADDFFGLLDWCMGRFCSDIADEMIRASEGL